MINVWCDGSITGGHWGKKKGPKTIAHAYSAWVAKTEGGEVISYRCVDLGEDPNHSANVAEYMAVRSALKWLIDSGYKDNSIFIRSDSQLIVAQLSGTNVCNVPKLIKLRDHVRDLAKDFPQVTYKWIPREQNEEADVLSKALQRWGTQYTWEMVLDYLR